MGNFLKVSRMVFCSACRAVMMNWMEREGEEGRGQNVGLNIWDNVLCLLENRVRRHPGLKIFTQVKAIFTTVCLLYII